MSDPARPTPLRPVAGVSLDALAEDPSRTRDLSPTVAWDLLARVAPLSHLLLVAALRENGHPEPKTAVTSDWLTADEAAGLLKKPRTWLIRHHRALPFARKVSRKTILFNRTGALRWLESRPR